MGDVLSLKWIDGNDKVVVDGQTASIYGSTVSPTFNVDNPSFWPPLSVLSGLASGFCERRAVLNSKFITGSTVEGGTTTNIEVDWYAGGIENRARLVNNCAHNMALGSAGDDQLFREPVNASMYPIGSAAGSNYMTAMDSAITTLIGTSDTYITPGGTVYAGFADLASAATNTAASAGSGLASAITSNGTDYAKVMYPGLPAEWAKERKWMLDELRWARSGNNVALNNEFSVDYLSGTITSDNSLSVTGSDTTYVGLGVQFTSAEGLFSSVKDLYRAGYCLKGTISSGGAIENTALYFGAVHGVIYPMNYSGVHYVSETETAAYGSRYCVLSGGTLTVATNLESVAVNAGGTLLMATSDASIHHLEIQSAAVVTPFIHNDMAYGYADSITYNYRQPDVHIFANAINPVACTLGGSTITGGGDLAVLGGSDTVVSGNGLSKLYVSGATVRVDAGNIGGLIVDNGGCVVVTTANTIGDDQAEVLPGGCLTISPIAGFTRIKSLDIMSGGTVTVTTDAYLEWPTMYEGAVMDIQTTTTDLGSGVNFVYCCPFGLAGMNSAGWTDVTATRIDSAGSDYLITGYTDSAEGSSTVAAAVSATMPSINQRITVISGGVSYPADPNLVGLGVFTGGQSAYYTAGVLAMNSRSLSDHYPSFYVRQFPTQEEEEDAAAEIISSGSQA